MGGFVDDITGDIFDFDGSKAAESQQQISNVLRDSAEANIALQERQFAEIEKLTEPFRAIATGTALPTLTALATGGDVDFQPSQLFRRQLESGREDILTGQAARGTLKSSPTFERLSDLVSGLAAQDIGRFEQSQLGLLQSGLRAEDVLRQSGTSTAGNVAGIFGNLGQGLNLAQQNLAQAQIAGAQSLGSGIQSLGQLALLA